MLAIAHEYAHIYLFATGDPTHTGRMPDDPVEKVARHSAMEAAVRETLLRWGFDLAEHDAAITWGHDTDWGER
jgi:hypothetical protein